MNSEWMGPWRTILAQEWEGELGSADGCILACLQARRKLYLPDSAGITVLPQKPLPASVNSADSRAQSWQNALLTSDKKLYRNMTRPRYNNSEILASYMVIINMERHAMTN